MTSAVRLSLVPPEVGDRYSDSDLVKQHLRMLKRRNASPNTVASREGALHRFLEWLGARHANLALTLVTLSILEDWQDDQKVSASATATYTIHVRAFFRWLTEQDIVASDPARQLVIPRVPKRLSSPITEQDLRDALAASRYDQALHCMLLLAAYCGLRAAEIAACAVEDFRPSEDNDGAFLTVHGKGAKDRIVRVPPKVFVQIRKLNRVRGPLFPSWKGQHITPNHVTQKVSKFFQEIKMGYTAHKLRHRFANRLADLGTDVRDIQASLGHESLQTTTLYLSLNSRRAAGAIDRLSEDLGGQ